LARTSKPLSEEEAAEHVQSRNHEGNVGIVGSSSSTMSNTSTPRGAPVVAPIDMSSESQLDFLAPPPVAAVINTHNKFPRLGFLAAAPAAVVIPTDNVTPSQLGFVAMGNSRIPGPTGATRSYRPPGFSNHAAANPRAHHSLCR
jgi:hypothetical protein